MTIDVQAVKRIAETLRKILEDLRTDFPFEDCDLASSLLLVVLHDHGFKTFAIVQGDRPDGVDPFESGHQWLESGEIVVDITGDQFAIENLPKVICGESLWHRKRNGKKKSSRTAATERAFYETQVKVLAAVQQHWPSTSKYGESSES